MSISFSLIFIDFDLLLYDHKVGNEIVADTFANIDSGYASIECRGYISPFDVLWMNWKREIESKEIFHTIRNGYLKNYTIFKTVSEIYYSSPEKGEQSFILPSQMIRELTDIKKGDGKYFYNLSGELIAFSSNDRAEIDMQEQLYIKKNYFENALKKKGMRPIWIVRLYRGPSSKILDVLEEFSLNSYRMWLYWKEESEFKSILFKDI